MTKEELLQKYIDVCRDIEWFGAEQELRDAFDHFETVAENAGLRTMPLEQEIPQVVEQAFAPLWKMHLASCLQAEAAATS